MMNLFRRKAKAPAPAVTPHSSITNPEFVHRFFKDAPTEALEVAHRVIGSILCDRERGVQ
jgi:hypothetical protein